MDSNLSRRTFLTTSGTLLGSAAITPADSLERFLGASTHTGFPQARSWVPSEALMQGLVMLQDAIEQERRPLSWVIGDQGVIKPKMPSQRDELKEERNQATILRPPNEV